MENVEKDDAIPQKPEAFHLLVPVFHTVNACPGAVTAHLLRRIAYRAGAYAPGIQEQMFHELNTASDGGTLESVQNWFVQRSKKLAQLGYRLQCKRASVPTPALLDWVKAGKGYRGAMLRTNFKRLHPAPNAGGTSVLEDVVAHAVGLTVDRLDPATDSPEELVMIDPWPGIGGDARDRDQISPHLEIAHKERGFQSLLYYWIGWS